MLASRRAAPVKGRSCAVRGGSEMLRSALHCAREWKAVRSSSLPSRKLVTTPGQRLTRCARRAAVRGAGSVGASSTANGISNGGLGSILLKKSRFALSFTFGHFHSNIITSKINYLPMKRTLGKRHLRPRNCFDRVFQQYRPKLPVRSRSSKWPVTAAQAPSGKQQGRGGSPTRRRPRTAGSGSRAARAGTKR